MPDPTTSNKLLLAPTRGSDSGTWDLPVNADWTALDGMLGGVTTIPLSSATTLLLTVPATGVVAATAGPNQSQNAMLSFSGTLTGTATIQFTMPGQYVINNRCTVGAFCVTLSPSSGTGNSIGAPPGQKVNVFYDGASMDFVDMPVSGSFLDMAVAATPAWMAACSVSPWLICDGSVYTSSIFPALNAILGSTFGGNGITTFGVPDLRARYRIPLDNQGSQGAAGRITTAISGINGTTIGSAGGSQNLQAHIHTTTITDPGHAHGPSQGSSVMVAPAVTPTAQVGAGAGPLASGVALTGVATTNISVAVNTAGVGSSGSIPPGLVFGITFIKT